MGAFLELGDVEHGAVGGGDLVGAGEVVLSHRGVEGDGTEGVGAEEEVGGGGLQELFDRVPRAAFARRVKEPRLGELADVITDSLPRGVEGAGGASGGVGVAEMGEDAESDRVECGGGLVGGAEDRDVGGDGRWGSKGSRASAAWVMVGGYYLTNIFVKRRLRRDRRV